mgnify:CR=1 FL=1
MKVLVVYFSRTGHTDRMTPDDLRFRIAAGRFDGFWERDLKVWDIAAGLLLVTEAGGKISEIDGADVMDTGNILATNTELHSLVQARLQAASA